MKGAGMPRSLKVMAAAAFACLIGTSALAQDRPAPSVTLEPGDTAPDFSLIGSDGKMHSLAGLKGKYVVLAWFPKAFTGG
jgi:cytochrome oxidase Cu insertion factor (SCO1/SenC/PrrC family)